jgi:DsbC/DsbD-like thiol-disulfide interchange protein
VTIPAPCVVLAVVMAVGRYPVADAQRPTDVIRWTAAGPEGPVKPGGTATIHLTADIDPGWHLYAFNQPPGGPRSLEVTSVKGGPGAVVSAKIDAPPPKVTHDPNFNLETRYYDEPTTIAVPVRIATAETPGARRVSLQIVFQACTERLCLRPYTETVSVDITVADGSGRGKGRS